MFVISYIFQAVFYKSPLQEQYKNKFSLLYRLRGRANRNYLIPKFGSQFQTKTFIQFPNFQERSGGAWSLDLATAAVTQLSRPLFFIAR